MRQTNYSVEITENGIRVTDQVSKCPLCNKKEFLSGYRMQYLTALPKTASDVLYGKEQYTCPGCAKKGLTFDIARHVLACPAIKVRCHYCHVYCPAMKLAEHVKNTCHQLTCPTSDDCGFESSYKNMRRHLLLHKLFPELMPEATSDTGRTTVIPSEIGNFGDSDSDEGDLEIQDDDFYAPILLQLGQEGY